MGFVATITHFVLLYTSGHSLRRRHSSDAPPFTLRSLWCEQMLGDSVTPALMIAHLGSRSAYGPPWGQGGYRP